MSNGAPAVIFAARRKPGPRRLTMLDRPIVAVMAKAPVCGAVKTRLARDLGAVHALTFYRSATASLLRTLSGDNRWVTALVVSPAAYRHARFVAWRGAGLRVAQDGGDLGARMQAIFDRVGRGPLIVVGSDIPFVTPRAIADAFRLLRGADAVLGPAEDGGYWLIGLRRRPKALRPFKDVRWSSERSLADTLRNLEGHRVAFAQTLYDVDDVEDYRRFKTARPPRAPA